MLRSTGTNYGKDSSDSIPILSAAWEVGDPGEKVSKPTANPMRLYCSPARTLMVLRFTLSRVCFCLHSFTNRSP